MFAVLALLMGAKFSGALISGPSSGGHASAASVNYYSGSTSLTPPAPVVNASTAVTYNALTGSVTVSWTNGANNGVVVTSYTVANPANSVTLCTTTNVGAGGAPNSCTWTPTSSNAYAGSVDVFANAAGGVSTIDSANASPITFATLSAPQTVNAAAKNGYYLVTWTANTGDSANGLTLINYQVYVGSTLVCTTTNLYCVVNYGTAGLSVGSSHTFAVYENNAAGLSTAGTASGVAATAPTAPQGLTATVDYLYGSVDVTYTAPASNGGATLGSYAYLANGRSISSACDAGITALTSATCSIPFSKFFPAHVSGGQLAPFTGTVSVVASNSIGSTPATSSVITINDVPVAPTSLVNTGSATTSYVAGWTASVGSTTGVAPTAYLVQLQTCATTSTVSGYCTDSGSPVVVNADLSPLAYTFTVPYGKIYGFSVRGISGAGMGAIAYAPTTAYTDLSAGAAPSASTVTVTSVTNSTLTVSYTAPTYTNGGTVTGYSLQLISGGSGASFSGATSVGSPVAKTAAGTYTFTGLTAGITYGVKVTVTTLAGVTNFSTAGYSAQYAVGAPIAINALGATSYSASGITFTWTALAAPYAVTYVVSSTGGSVLCTAVSGANSCTAPSAAVAAAITATGTSSASAYLSTTDANGATNVISSALGTTGVATFTKTNGTGVAPSVTNILKNGVTTSASYGSVDVEWNAVSNATSYNVVANGSDGSQVKATTTGSNYVFASSVLTATSYTFQVAAVGPAGSTAYSTATAATKLASIVAPDAPVAIGTAAQDALATGLTGTAHLGLGNSLALVQPTAAANGNALAVSFVADPSALSDGQSVVSYTAKLTIASGQNLTCVIPVAGYATTAQLTAAAKSAIFAAIYKATYGLAYNNVRSGDSFNAVQTSTGNAFGTYQSLYNSAPGTANSAVIANRIATATANAAAAAGAGGYVTGLNTGVSHYGTNFKLYTCTFIGIAANNTNTFSVVANSAFTSSASSNALAIVNTGVSGAPTGLKVVYSADSTVGTVTWVAPSSSPSNISGYTVTVTGDDGSSPYCPVTTTAVTCTFPSTPSVTYTVSVAANEDIVGYSAGGGSSAAATITAATNDIPATSNSAPNAPTAVVAGSMGVKITWTAPATGGSAITAYQITPVYAAGATPNVLSAGSCLNAAGTTTGITLNLANDGTTPAAGSITVAAAAGTTITCTYDYVAAPAAVSYVISALNAVGWSYNSLGSTSVTPVHVLNSPGTAMSFLNTDGSFLVMWSPVTYATSYTVTVTGGPSVLTYNSTTTSFLVPAKDLNSSLTYTAVVTTNNAVGNTLDLPNTQAWTSRSAGDTSGTNAAPAPSAPTLYRYLTSSAATSITLGWMSNSSGSLLPVTYTVTSTKSGVITTLASGLTTTSYVAAYDPTATYGVTEVSAAGSTSNSGSTTFTGGVAASTPSFVNATSTATGTSATLSWSANENSAGGAPYSFTTTLTSPTGTVIACPASYVAGFTTTASANATPHTSSCTFSGLTANTLYSYSVVETAVAGNSVALVGGFDTTATVPGSPVLTSIVKSATVGVASTTYTVTVNWTAPVSSGSSPITGYYVTATVGGTLKACSTVLTASSTSCSFSSTTPFATSAVSVQAMNAAGLSNPATTVYDIPNSSDGDYSGVKTWTASAAPPTVIGLTVATPSVGTIVATWTDNGNQNTAAVTDFLCSATDGYGNVTSVTVLSTVNTCTITGLANTTYTVSVQEHNAYAGGTYGTAATATAYPVVSSAFANFGAASVVSGTISAQWIKPVTTDTWTAAASANTGTITGYTITATDASGNVFTCSAAATANLCTVTGLANNTSYTVTIVATSSVGVSYISNSLVVKTISATAAAAPVITGAVRNATGLGVSWTAPATAGSGQLVGYWVTASDALTGQQYTCPYNATYGVLLAPSVSCNITGLTVGNSYTVSVTAITKDGAGAVQTSVPATKVVTYTSLAPAPVNASFTGVATLSAGTKAALNNLISTINDGAKITVTGYGTTKAIALARANAAANYLFNNGAAVHVTIKSVISKTIKTALVTVTQN
jgi:hypothetical protein